MSDELPEYRLSTEARRDLEAIWIYTLTTWGLEQANRYTDELDAAFNALAEHPQMASQCDHIRTGYRRFQAGRHHIYFRTAEYGIAVIRVLHDRMLPARNLGLEAKPR